MVRTLSAYNYNNLAIAGNRTTNNLSLVNTGIIGIASTFNPIATFSSGTYITTGSTVDFNGSSSQTIPPFNYNNLTISGTRTTTNNVTLVNGGTINIAGTFSPTATFGTGGYVINGNTINFNGTTTQTVPAFNYNNLTISNARTAANNVTLINAGTIGIAGTFSPTATFGTGGYVITGNTVDFNGNSAQTVPAFTFNNLTISNTTSGATLSGYVTVNGILTTNATTANLVVPSGGSLITNGTITLNSKAKVERAIAGGEWHYISSTISDATSCMFLGKYLQKHTESTNLYTDITSTTEALTPMRGYALWGDASGFTASFIGKLNTGNIGTANNLTRTTNGINSGWNLVGNPYPSSIRLKAALGLELGQFRCFTFYPGGGFEVGYF